MSRQEPVKFIRKGSAVILAKRWRSTRQLTRVSHFFHKITHCQLLSNIVFRVEVSSGIQRMAVSFDHSGGQRDIRSNHQIARLHPLGDVVVGRIETARYLHGLDGSGTRNSQGLIGDQNKRTVDTFRGAKQDLFGDLRAGMGIDSDPH